jgi:phosphoglycerol transferase MdoB-like AlkP superfamily enzyme
VDSSASDEASTAVLAEEETTASTVEEPRRPIDPEPAETDESTVDIDGPVAVRERRRWITPWVRTAAAAVLIVAALLLPDDLTHLRPSVFLRIPAEALLAVALLVLLPRTPRRVLAIIGAVGLALLTVLRFIDIGFSAVLDRPFDLVFDWSLLGSATGVVEDSVGRLGAVGAVIGVVLLVGGMITFMVRSALRLTGIVAAHRNTSLRAVGAVTVIWVACAALGADLVPGLPVASRADAALVYHRAVQVHAGLADKRQFAQQLGVDPYRNTPPSQLLTGLQGKDIVFAYVESYGRSAITNSLMAPIVDPTLDDGTKALKAAGFDARSGFLTSSTVGGNSWLAHSTTFSGLWVNNQQRYHTLVKSDRLTLPRMFNEAGWRTISVEPAIFGPWPEVNFYGYDKGYANADLDYAGPHFSYAPMPDQYTFQTIQQKERQPGHKPLFAEITMVSSHGPFTPIPKMTDWDKIGNGAVYREPSLQEGDSVSTTWKSINKARVAYAKSVSYSLSTLISYMQKYGNKDTVLVFLGDHQPAPIVTGANATRDVPITIVAKDPKVLDRVAGWNWTPGLRPAANAPVWKMDSFRDKFVTAFGSSGAVH